MTVWLLTPSIQLYNFEFIRVDEGHNYIIIRHNALVYSTVAEKG